jgi:hypothetical protein
MLRNSDNPSDTIYSDSSINEDNDNIFESLNEHTVINEKNNDESSIDSNKKKQLDDISFDINSEEILKSSFYSLEELNKKTFKDIYNIINLSVMIIFVDNYKLCNLNKRSLFRRLRTKKYLYEEEFPGCTFFPFEYINKFKKHIHLLNNKILDGEFKNYKIYDNDDLCYGICFDEGDIFKNILYKKMEIINRILFIPINKYNIKETEYKIRGFCQIVEELGAKKIEITFQKNDKKLSKKKIDASLGTDIELIAGNLGLQNSKMNEEKEDHKYTLEYPSYNTIILNEKSIRKKIKKKKMIISDTIYNSNLELQYLISSRCRHFITTYLTTFTLDSNVSIDKKLALKFKSHNIELGLSSEKTDSKKNYIQIITNIEFVKDIENQNNIMGNSVSLDSVGFLFLMNTIKNRNDFKIVGIYKIIDFINLYINKVIKHTNYYKYINNVMDKIKKEFTLKEYALLLNNYFDENSQWIHFTNFIDLLQNKSKSYDKLGYLITINYNISCVDTKINNIVKFIQELCILRNIEDKFWKMLMPNNKELHVFLKDKLVNNYNIIDTFNWFSLNSLLNDIQSYEIEFNIENNDEYLKKLINNMNYGYKYYEFYERVVPFIIKRANSFKYESNIDVFMFNIFEELLNYESFNVYRINTIKKLDDYIKQKIDEISKIQNIINDFNFYNKKNTNLVKFFNTKKFISSYPYFSKKINIICNNNRSEYLESMIIEIIKPIKRMSKNFNVSSDITKGKLSKIKSDTINLDNDIKYNIIIFLKKVLTYNEKINISKLPICIYTFDLINKNYKNGVKYIDYKRYIIPFIKKLLQYILNNNIIEISRYINTFESYVLNKISMDEYDYKVNNYYDLLNYIEEIINTSDFILSKDLIQELTYI